MFEPANRSVSLSKLLGFILILTILFYLLAAFFGNTSSWGTQLDSLGKSSQTSRSNNSSTRETRDARTAGSTSLESANSNALLDNISNTFKQSMASST